MNDPELSSSQYGDRRERASSPLPSLSNSSSLNDIQHHHQQQHQQGRSPAPPPVKTRFPLSIGDHLAKAARRLSLVTTSSKEKDNHYNPPPSPALLRSGATSPDLKKKRNSTLDDFYSNIPQSSVDGRENRDKSNNNSGSSGSNIKNGNNNNNKGKEKKPLVKIDLFNLKSRNNTSQVNLVSSPIALEKSLPEHPPPPPPPSKETFWRGVMRQSVVCTEDDYIVLSQQSQLKEKTQVPRDNSKPGTEHFALGHTEHERDDIKNNTPIQQDQLQQQARVASPEPFMRPMSPTPPSITTRQQFGQQQLVSKSTTAAKDIPPMRPPLQTGDGMASTMSEDLSQLSINSYQESTSSVSDESLQMEDMFDVYDSSQDGSHQGSLRNTTVGEGDTRQQQQRQRNFLYQQSENKPLSALERIQLQQKQRSQEQERLADLIIPPSSSRPTPSSSSSSSGAASATATTTAEASSQQPGAATAAAMDIENNESAMLDQLLSLVPGPNRPRLPSQIEWQKGFEEMRQKRKEAAASTSSVGRQNSSSSRHSQESSDSRSRRHSMPDMPRGQSREDQERQRGDNFKNPMLVSSSPLHLPAGGASDVGLPDNNNRRSGYGDREQLLQQQPIQKQPIAKFTAEPKQMRNNHGKAGAATGVGRTPKADSPLVRDAVSPVERMRDSDKDAVDIAFDEMLASLSLSAASRAQLESLPKDQKRSMLQSNSNDAHPTVNQTPQTVPPQFFVEALLEYSGKKKRSSRDQVMFNPGPSNKSLGLWKNLSATNLSTGIDNGNNMMSNFSTDALAYSSSSSASTTSPTTPSAPTFQQHLASLLGGGKNEKRTLEEREQVLKKLRVLIRNGSIRWTAEFIKAGGPLALLQFCHHLQKSEETKLGQREKLLHQVVLCIKAIVSLDGGVESLVKEPFFFPLMRTLAIHSAPVMAPNYNPMLKSKTGLFPGATGTFEQQQQRSRSSSIPKPIQSRFGFGHHTPSRSSPPLTVDQIPTFSNAQGSVGILVAILSREPELRDQILKETVADPSSPSLNQRNRGDDVESNGGTTLKYSEWINYLKEIVHICGVDVTLPAASPEGFGHDNVALKDTEARKRVSGGQMAPGTGASGPHLSLFSLENMRKRRNSGTLMSGPTSPNPGAGGIKYESGEDREVLAYLTAHLELVSKLMVDVHISTQGLAFAKSVKESRLDEYLEVLRSTHIQNQDLSAQIEDLVIQLSMVPCATQPTASATSCELPAIPPFDSLAYQQYQQQRQQQQQQQQQEQQMRPTSPTSLFSTSSSVPSASFYDLQYPLPDAKHGPKVVLKGTAAEIPPRGSSLEAYTIERRASINYNNNINSNNGGSAVNGGNGVQRPSYGGGIARNTSQYKPSPSQLLPSQQQQQQQQQHQQSQQSGVTGRTRKASVINNHRHSIATPPLTPGPSRQVSVKRISLDGAVGVSNRGIGSYSPIPPENRRSLIHEPYNREMQHTPSRLTTLSSSTTTTPISIPNPITSRRATVGETAPVSTTPLSMSPTVPPKNKNRPLSIDAKGGKGNGLLLPRTEYTTIKLDQQRPSVNYTKVQLTPKARDVENVKDRDTVASNADTDTSGATTSAEDTENEPVPRSSSANTFGRGRRSSLNNPGYMMSNSNDSSLSGTDSSDSSVDVPVNASSSKVFSIPSGPHRDLGRNHGHDHGHRSNYSLDGMSSCSSTISSSFTTTTSNSSVSPPSTQTRKQSLLTTAAVKESLASNARKDTQPTVSSSTSNSSSNLPQTPPSLSSPLATATSKPLEKPIHEFKDIDFDTRIQEDVRKLALSSSNERKNAAAGSPMIAKLEIQATDPRVLEAPIVVPEDMSMMREQYIRDQLDRIVLPPMERRSVTFTTISTGTSTATGESKVDARPASTPPITTTVGGGGGVRAAAQRRLNVSGGIPILSQPLSKTISFEETTKRTATGADSSHESKLPQLGGPRRRSGDLIAAAVTTTPGVPVPASGKARISDRIKMFERS
ncbi:hypothetical protein BGX20_007532 [Mortierella sp. AD010]|nr:hypothetical protein BGX20_007532 [Mortierella sp. AD010]